MRRPDLQTWEIRQDPIVYRESCWRQVVLFNHPEQLDLTGLVPHRIRYTITLAMHRHTSKVSMFYDTALIQTVGWPKQKRCRLQRAHFLRLDRPVK